MNPDIIVGQEFLSASAVTAFLAALNTAPGTSGTWAAGTFVNGPDTDNAFFYRSDRVDFLQHTIVGPGGGTPLPPRDTTRYDVRLKGYGGFGPKLAIYAAHMKSGSTSDDEARRLAEATRIRFNAQNLPNDFAGTMVVGDFNTQTWTDGGFLKLVQSEANNVGRFFDPINTLASWDNNSAYRFVHTQDPVGAGGMDSRFDFLLLSSSLVDGVGFDYIGNPAISFSTTTWNDINHSYRSWGNDGSTYNGQIAVATNSMVGAVIAQALKNASTTAGHLPVFLDLRVPAEISAMPGIVGFGNVVQGSSPTSGLSVGNGVDTILWRTGIASLTYSMAASPGFSAPGGSFTDAAGGGSNLHGLGVNTSTVGPKSGTLTITATDPRVPPMVVNLSANVIPDAIAPTTVNLLAGSISGGGVSQLLLSDDQRLDWQNANWTNGGRFTPVLHAEFETTSSLAVPNSMTFEMESRATGTFNQDIELFDFVAGQFVLADSRPSTGTDSTVVLNLATPARFVQAGTLKLRARVTLTPSSWSMPRILSGGIDRLVWKPR